MLELIVACVLVLQMPQSPLATWVADGGDPARPRALAFCGSVELSPAEAQATAEAKAREALVARVRREASDKANAGAAFWLPRTVLEGAVERWALEQVQRTPFEVLDRQQIVRDHGFGNSFQTHLLVEPVSVSEREWRALSRTIERVEHRLMAIGGGTLVLWTLLIAAFWWVDRLSRGYMTGRLATLAVSLAILGPGVAFLFLH